MPGRDGTGPMGQGMMTGRGMGLCAGVPVPGYTAWCGGRGHGRGLGFGRGPGRGWGKGYGYPASSKEGLEAQKDYLTNMLNEVNRQMEKKE